MSERYLCILSGARGICQQPNFVFHDNIESTTALSSRWEDVCTVVQKLGSSQIFYFPTFFHFPRIGFHADPSKNQICMSFYILYLYFIVIILLAIWFSFNAFLFFSSILSLGVLLYSNFISNLIVNLLITILKKKN